MRDAAERRSGRGAPPPDALVVAVRLTPSGGRDGFDGLGHARDGRAVLKARVRAAPEDGKANAALRRTAREGARRPVTARGLTAGATSRFKTLGSRATGRGASPRARPCRAA